MRNCRDDGHLVPPGEDRCAACGMPISLVSCSVVSASKIFEEAKALLKSGDTEALAAFASRNVDERAQRAAAAARADDSELT